MSDYEFDCPHCNQHLSVSPDVLGQDIECPTCDGQIRLPPEPRPNPVRPKEREPSQSPQLPQSCPLCRNEKDMDDARMLYGHLICRKCYYSFANRRQMAFVLDFLCLCAFLIVVEILFSALLPKIGFGKSATAVFRVFSFIIGLCINFAFLLKDGFFSGQSFGKSICDVAVIDKTTGKPCDAISSLKRNLPLLIPIMPIVVGLTLRKGYRIGDGWANTKVIWEKYAKHPVFSTHMREVGKNMVVAKPVVEHTQKPGIQEHMLRPEPCEEPREPAPFWKKMAVFTLIILTIAICIVSSLLVYVIFLSPDATSELSTFPSNTTQNTVEEKITPAVLDKMWEQAVSFPESNPGMVFSKLSKMEHIARVGQGTDYETVSNTEIRRLKAKMETMKSRMGGHSPGYPFPRGTEHRNFSESNMDSNTGAKSSTTLATGPLGTAKKSSQSLGEDNIEDTGPLGTAKNILRMNCAIRYYNGSDYAPEAVTTPQGSMFCAAVYEVERSTEFGLKDFYAADLNGKKFNPIGVGFDFGKNGSYFIPENYLSDRVGINYTTQNDENHIQIAMGKIKSYNHGARTKQTPLQVWVLYSVPAATKTLIAHSGNVGMIGGVTGLQR